MRLAIIASTSPAMVTASHCYYCGEEVSKNAHRKHARMCADCARDGLIRPSLFT